MTMEQQRGPQATATRGDAQTDASPFPLPLSAFEEYMVKDDRPGYPMTFCFRLRFSGQLERHRLERAVSHSVARHPLLRARIAPSRRGRHVWQAAAIGPEINWHAELPRDQQFPPSHLDTLNTGPGLRLDVVRGATAASESSGDQVFFHFHHACTDGQGALQFIEDVLVAYHCDGDVAELTRRLPPRHCSRLQDRARRDRNWLDFLQAGTNVWFGCVGAMKFFLRFPAPLVPQAFPRTENSPGAPYPNSCEFRLEAHELATLRQRARTVGATTYELMVAELFLAIAEFREERAGTLSHQWLRLNIPFNLRRPQHIETPACNIVSMVFLDRRGRKLRDQRRLLASIHAELWRVKRFNVKYTFVSFANLLWCWPRLYNLLARSRRCFATALFTNLGTVLDTVRDTDQASRKGVPWAVGQLDLESIDALAPIRPLTNVALALTLYAGCAWFVLHYDRGVLEPPEAASLLERFRARLRAPGPAE